MDSKLERSDDAIVHEIRAKLLHLDLLGNREKFVFVDVCPQCKVKQLSVVETLRNHSELCTSTLNPSCGYSRQFEK